MKKRIDWIDIVRAMGMFLIIMGHTLEGYTYSIVGKLIFAVHVPVFFVLSGYLYKEKPVKKVFKGGNVNLLLPYLATLLIVVIITRFNFIFPNWIYKLDMHDFLISAFYGSGTTLNPFWDKSLTINAIGAIWFLLAMYFGNIIFNTLIKSSRGNLFVSGVVAMAITFGGFYLSDMGILLPWSLNAAMASQLFYYGGYLIKKFDLIEKYGISGSIVGVALWMISAQSGFLYLNIAHADSPILAVLGGIGGSFSLMYLAKLLCETKLNLDAVKYYGQMSLIVLCVHLIDLNTCAISGKIYENLIQTTGDQIIAVSMEILYRFLLTVVGIIVIPRLPIVRSFYLNRVYPFWAKK